VSTVPQLLPCRESRPKTSLAESTTRYFPNRHCRRPHKLLVLKSRPLHRLSPPINNRCRFSLHPAPPNHLPPFSPSLLAPPPQLTTTCIRPPPKSRLHRPSPTKVSGGVGRPRRPLRFAPSPSRCHGQRHRRAPLPAGRPVGFFLSPVLSGGRRGPFD
jgi:hypothetical protein